MKKPFSGVLLALLVTALPATAAELSVRAQRAYLRGQP